MKSFDGYLKRKIGDSHILLAGGGTKALSDLVESNYYANITASEGGWHKLASFTGETARWRFRLTFQCVGGSYPVFFSTMDWYGNWNDGYPNNIEFKNFYTGYIDGFGLHVDGSNRYILVHFNGKPKQANIMILTKEDILGAVYNNSNAPNINFGTLPLFEGEPTYTWMFDRSYAYYSYPGIVSPYFVKTDSNNTKVLLGGGNDKNLSDFVGTVSYNSSTKKLQYTPIGGTASDIVTFGDRAFDSTAYLPLTGGTMTGNLYLKGSANLVTNSAGSYANGIRINRSATSNWAGMTIGYVSSDQEGGGTGYDAHTWMIATPANSDYLNISKNGNSSVAKALTLQGHGDNDLKWNNNTVYHAGNFNPNDYVTAVAVTDDTTNHPNLLRYVKNGTSNYFTVPFATNATNATNARYVIGDNDAASASGALLQSGSGRANDSTGDTWLFLDNRLGTSSPYGIKHNLVDDSIDFIGGGTVRSKIYLNTNGIYSANTISGGNIIVNAGYVYLRKPLTTNTDNNIVSDNRIYAKCGNNTETTGIRFYSIYYPDSSPLRTLYRTYFMNGGSYIDYNSYPADTQGSTTLILGTSTKIGTAGSAYGAILLFSRQAAGNTDTVRSGMILTTVLTGNRTYTLPDATGTIALTSDIPSTKNININGSNYSLYTSASSLPTIYAPTASGTGFLKSSVSNNVVTWSYDDSTYSLSSHSHTFAQVTSKITYGSEFNFIDSEKANIWFNYRRASGSVATTPTAQFNFGQGTATSAYAYLKAEGFKKNGSSGAKLLLGDGTDKALNTLLTAVGRTANTDNLYVTVGGNTLSVTLGARAWDSTAYLPLAGGVMTGAILWGLNYNNTTEAWNLPATSSAAGIYPMNATTSVGAPSDYCIGLTVSGRYSFLLASPANSPSQLYVRSYTDTTWAEIITSNNIGSQSVSFANDVPFPYSSQAHYGTTASANKYIKVTINSTVKYMISFVLRVYTSYKSYDVVISGYYNGNNHWTNVSALLYASTQDTLVVSFGYDADGNLWVVVPVESYTGASVFNCVNGYNLISKTEKELFVITQVDAIPNTVLHTITAKRPLKYDENAATATKWAATKTFTIGATGRNVDGSANTSWSLADIFGSAAIGSVALPVYWSGSAFTTTLFTAGSKDYGTHNANDIKSDGVWYYSSNGPAASLGATTSDGALYSQAHSTTWAAQIAQDYRNGRLFIRGLNNGSWTDWLNVRDSGNTYVTNGVGYIGNSEVTTVKHVIGNDDSASFTNALLLSGPNRANTAAGDTWIFWDTYSGTSSPNGIKHDLVNDVIRFYGAGTAKVLIGLATGDISATRNIAASGNVSGGSVKVNNDYLYMYKPVTTAEDTGIVTADNRIYWKYGNNSSVYMRYVTTYNPTTEVIGSTFFFPGYGLLTYTTVPIGTQGAQYLIIGSTAKRGNAANALYGVLRLMSLQASDNTESVRYGQILTALLTSNRNYYLPDATGTIALTSNIPGNFVKSGSTAAAGLVPSPGTTAGTTKFLREDATWQVPTNTTYKLTINGTTNGDSTNGISLGTINVFGASGTNHAIGLVPDPGKTAGTTKFLREDGSWQVPTYTWAGITSKPSSTGSATKPVYWNGSTFVEANSYPTKSSWNYDDVYLKLSGGKMTGGINMNRANASNGAGIEFYSSSHNTWLIYMNSPGSNLTAGWNKAITTVPSGTYVTSWALRCVIEGTSGYGWTWESMASTGVSPNIIMELSSSTGNLKTIGSIYAANFYSTSDIRKKLNIHNISENVREFILIDSGQKAYGFIAQELEDNGLTELVNSDGEYKTVNYNSALSYYIALLENRVRELENKLREYGRYNTTS